MTAETRARLKLYTVEELEDLPEPAWLLEGLLPEGGLVELYGKPGVGKSFLALDWALSLAAGGSWLGHPLKQAGAVYVSAEGGTGLKRRVAAWRTKHPGTDLDWVRFLKEPVNMRDGGKIGALIQAIQEASLKPGLVVIDTLARCFGDGDENAAVDMNRFVKGTDLIKGTFSQATVLVVHHTGKDPRRGDRGSSVLRAAADTMMELTATGGSKALTLKCGKQKDWDPFEDFRLSLRVVTLEDGETSCVIAAGQSQADPVEAGGNENDAKSLDALKGFGPKGAGYNAWQKASGVKRSTFRNVRDRLVGKGLVHHEGTLYRIGNASKGQGQGQGQAGF